MNKAWKYLAGSILNGATPEEVGQDVLDDLLAQYPYYAGLHYLKAASPVGPDAGASARAKAALYFQNPHWFRALLDDTETVHTTESSIAEALITPSSDWSPPADETGLSHTEETANVVDQAEQAYDNKRSPEPHNELHWQNALAENPVFHQETSSDEESFEHSVWRTQDAEKEDMATAISNEDPEDTIAELPENIAVDQSPAGELTHPVPEAGTEPEDVSGSEGAARMTLMEGPEQVTTPDPSMETKPGEPGLEEPVIPFEPLYTIDYFASQGIKYNLDAGKDQLSLKMKSFTEWLKSMKRIHPEKVETGAPDDAAIRENAESSNETQDIYTEAMAEVYLKQGLKEKAREVFQKLSLLDPSKSAYFAVRIKEIKEN